MRECIDEAQDGWFSRLDLHDKLEELINYGDSTRTADSMTALSFSVAHRRVNRQRNYICTRGPGTWRRLTDDNHINLE